MFKKLKTQGFFFWRKDKKSESDKAEDMLKLYVKYIPQLRAIMNEGQTLGSVGSIVGQMYDFYENYNHTIGDHRDFILNPLGEGVTMKPKKEDERISATPLSVMTELETVPTPFNLEGLDEKIETLKDKTKLLNQRYAKAQIEGLCKRLENRKGYRDHVEFYSSFPNTTDEKIDTLLGKYKLVMKVSDLFVPTFPKEAVDIMKKYNEVTEKITTEKLVYYVIAEEKDFVKKLEKLDPILLVQSPFGFYWQVLGAWDKEMLLLSEL